METTDKLIVDIRDLVHTAAKVAAQEMEVGKLSLSAYEMTKLMEWISTKKIDPESFGHDRFTFYRKGCSIGTSLDVVDRLDNSRADLTDYDSW